MTFSCSCQRQPWLSVWSLTVYWVIWMFLPSSFLCLILSQRLQNNVSPSNNSSDKTGIFSSLFNACPLATTCLKHSKLRMQVTFRSIISVCVKAVTRPAKVDVCGADLQSALMLVKYSPPPPPSRQLDRGRGIYSECSNYSREVMWVRSIIMLHRGWLLAFLLLHVTLCPLSSPDEALIGLSAAE